MLAVYAAIPASAQPWAPKGLPGRLPDVLPSSVDNVHPAARINVTALVIAKSLARFEAAAAQVRQSDIRSTVWIPAVFLEESNYTLCGGGGNGLRHAMRNAWNLIASTGLGMAVIEEDAVYAGGKSNVSVTEYIVTRCLQSQRRCDLAYLGEWNNWFTTHAVYITPHAAQWLLDMTTGCYPPHVQIDQGMHARCMHRPGRPAWNCIHPPAFKLRNTFGQGFFVQDRVGIKPSLHASKGNRPIDRRRLLEKQLPATVPAEPKLKRAYVQGSQQQAKDLAATSWSSTILVGTHHKTGTVLLSKLFRLASKFMGVPRLREVQVTNRTQCAHYFHEKQPAVCLVEHMSARDLHAWAWKPNVPFIHAVRDPLEMCVSAYQYHLLGAEPWLNQPLRDLNGSSLQQYYNAIGPKQAVAFECKRMMFELVETTLIYNATKTRPRTLTVRLEDFGASFDDTVRGMFQFLGTSPSHTDQLVNASAAYDLKRTPALDARHVSSTVDKSTLRNMVMSDPLVGQLMTDLRVTLGYAGSSRASPNGDQLCELLLNICSSTHVGFMHWCSYGRIHPGRLPSLRDCGDASHSLRMSKKAGALPSAVERLLDQPEPITRRPPSR